MAILTINANDQLNVRAFCYMQNQAAVNQFSYLVLSVVGSPVAALILDALSGQAGPAYVGWLAQAAKYEGMKMTVVRAGTKFATVVSVAGAGIGLPGSDPQPKQVAGLTTKLTDFAGRSYRGRTYWPFPAKDVADTTGAPSAGQKSAMGALGGALLVPMTLTASGSSCQLQPILPHKKAGLVATAITSTLVSSKWATQRRRGDYGRPNQTML